MWVQLKIFAAAVVVAYLLLCGGLYLLQRRLIYFPVRGESRAAMVLASAVGPVRVSRVEGEGKGALIYFGGNAEDVSLSGPQLRRELPGWTIYLMHYRGYGGSAGEPNEAGLVEDARQLFDLVAKQHERVMVVGRSLGSGIAVRLASERPVDALGLVTPFDSIVSVARARMWFLPVGWLLEDRYESVRYAPEVKARTMVLAAERDEVISGAHTEALVKSFREGRVDVVRVPFAGHNDIQERPEYWAGLRRLAEQGRD